jgi:hypothetical protein
MLMYLLRLAQLVLAFRSAARAAEADRQNDERRIEMSSSILVECWPPPSEDSWALTEGDVVSITCLSSRLAMLGSLSLR